MTESVRPETRHVVPNYRGAYAVFVHPARMHCEACGA